MPTILVGGRPWENTHKNTKNQPIIGEFLALKVVCIFTREYMQCTAGYTFCFVVVVGAVVATFNQTWQLALFQLTVDD
jgi:hypothetical protein